VTAVAAPGLRRHLPSTSDLGIDIVCHAKPNLPNQTDSNAALLPYLTHQLGLAHE